MSRPPDGTTTDQDSIAPTAYQRIGGGPAVKAAVEKFYELVLADPELRGFFVNDSNGGSGTVNLVELRRHLAALLASVLGGPDTYSGRDLATAHQGLGITGAHFDLVADYLEATLLLLHIPRDIVSSTMATVGGLRGTVIGSAAGTA